MEARATDAAETPRGAQAGAVVSEAGVARGADDAAGCPIAPTVVRALIHHGCRAPRHPLAEAVVGAGAAGAPEAGADVWLARVVRGLTGARRASSAAALALAQLLTLATAADGAASGLYDPGGAASREAAGRQARAGRATGGQAMDSRAAGGEMGVEQAAVGIEAVEGLRLGHFTLPERPTGCTVILAEGGAVAGVDVRGGAPGTREVALLDPVNRVQTVHAIVLAGGSAFGLDAASGVVRYLEEQGVGFEVGAHRVPIVAGAILFDLGVGDGSIRPGPECGYRAALAAATPAAGAAPAPGPVPAAGKDRPLEGSVGAGAGATVGKLAGMARAMKGGVGTASITLEDGLVVAAVVAVNAVGDIIDPATSRIVAGVRSEDLSAFADARSLLRAGERPVGRGGERPGPSAAGPGWGGESAITGVGGNTTIGVVATNAALSKSEITKVAQMAHDGIARTIYPAHTPADGDTVFGLATGTHPGDGALLRIGALAAEVMSEAILRAVRTATGLPGLPAASEFPTTGPP